MLSYSVAIRTLGKNPVMLREELESVFAQSYKPSKVVIYIAEGYDIPSFRVADEIYVPVKKGMTTQRALDYDEIDTPLILMLDDDVYLYPDSAATLVQALEDNDYDCVSPDTFANHRMSVVGKIYSFFTNLSLPLRNARYAFTIHSNGTLSYLSNPSHGLYKSQSASGPCALWRKDVFKKLDIKSECWIDTLPFAYSEDQLMYYKLYVNGGKLGVYYGSGVEHRDGRVARAAFDRDTSQFYTRAKAQYIVWHRSVRGTRRGLSRLWAHTTFMAKLVWLLPVHVVAAFSYRDHRVVGNFIKGTISGWKFTRTDAYRSLPPYRQ